MTELIEFPKYASILCPFLMIGFIAHFWQSYIKISHMKEFEAIFYSLLLLSQIGSGAWVIDAAISQNLLELLAGLILFSCLEFVRIIMAHLLGCSVSRAIMAYIFRKQGKDMRQKSSDKVPR